MDPATKSILLFLLGCMPVRILTVFIAKEYKEYLSIMAPVAFLMALGFTLIYILGLRKTGAETFGETIWWNSLRPVHAILYYLFAYSAFMKKDYAWVFLAVDVLIGGMSFINHRFLKN
jgi:hypothetical protein